MVERNTLMKYGALGRMLMLVWTITVLLGCSPRFNPPAPDTNRDSVLHKPSGISFPFQVALFTRSAMDIHDDVAEPITADYFFVRSDKVVTMRVRVYPKPDRSLHEEMEILKNIQLAVEKDPESRFIATYDIPNSQGEKLYTGKRAFFRIRDDAFANIYIFEYGNWYVEYHTIFPRNLEREAEAFVTEFSWAVKVD